MYHKRCNLCGNNYISKSRNAKYCSEECKKEEQKKQRKIWNEEHPNYKREYMRKYRKKSVEEHALQSDDTMQRCTYCGELKERTSENFGSHCRRKYGFTNECKVCKKKRDQKRYKEKRSEILEQKKQYYQLKKQKGVEL